MKLTTREKFIVLSTLILYRDETYKERQELFKNGYDTNKHSSHLDELRDLIMKILETE